MRRLAPADTETLKRSIHSKASALSGRVLIGPEAYYWRFVEFGTVRTAARPFVRSATEIETGPFVQRMTDVARELERDLASGKV